jgi:SAM-dependent methyltransferase
MMMDLVLANARKPSGALGVYGAQCLSHLHAQYYDLVLNEIKPLAGLRILEVGCGVSAHARGIALSGAFYTGMDHSEDVIGECDSRFGSFFCGDVTKCALPVSDAVFMVNVLQWIYDPGAALRAIHSALTPGGLIVIGAPDEECIRRDRIEGLGLCSAKQMDAMIRYAGFRNVRVKKAETEKTRYLLGVGVA